MTINGTAATTNASRYLQQVCKHWSHRFAVTFDATQGHVDFGDESALDIRADADSLHFAIHCDRAASATMREIVEEHIQRFAHKEGTLAFTWEPDPA